MLWVQHLESWISLASPKSKTGNSSRSSLKKGGFVTLRHNTVRDLTENLLSEVCKVRVKSPSNQLTGETLDKASNTSDEARLDIGARCFWISGQKAFQDNRQKVQKFLNLQSVRNKRKRKKRHYYNNSRILEVEHGFFTPIVFSAMGGMGREARSFYKRLSEVFSENITSWMRRKVIFALMRSIILCLQGSRIPWSTDHLYSFKQSSSSELLCSF